MIHSQEILTVAVTVFSGHMLSRARCPRYAGLTILPVTLREEGGNRYSPRYLSPLTANIYTEQIHLL